MEVESFENQEVAKMLNDWFVSIKVDREERPDVDKVYMTYVQSLHGSGGWPLSAFLSPSLNPLMAGTYFPPEDMHGRIGFKTILRKVNEAWKTKREILEKDGADAIEQLSEAFAAISVNRNVSNTLNQNSLKLCAEMLEERYDKTYGGFGVAPKFPRPVELHLMLYYSKKLLEDKKQNESKETLQIVCHSLQCMSRGGVHDHVGGGFHRYSVDECWHVPHFEKMLYDQGQLVNVYLDAFSYTKDTFYSTIARDILDYLKRDMIGESGEIYSAEDADSAEHVNSLMKKEGAFYIWTIKEIEDILGDSANIFKDHYYIKASGNCDLSEMSDRHDEFKGKNILLERKDVSFMASKWGMSKDEYNRILGTCRQILFNKREGRPKPHLDDKVIVSWNGLVISAFARASKILLTEATEIKFNFPVVGCNPGEYMEVAEKAASFIKNNLYNEDECRLYHSYRIGPSKAPGFLNDYAFLIAALLDMYEYGGQIRWLSWAINLQAKQDELFWDKNGGGYFNTPGEDPSILLRMKEDYDGSEPSGNSVSAFNLLRLSSMFMGEKSDYYRETAEHLLLVFEKRLKEQTLAIPLLCCAADILSSPSRKQIVVVGNKTAKEFSEMVTAVHENYEPNKTVIQVDPSASEELDFWQSNNPSIAQMAKTAPTDKFAIAYICQNFVCRAPVTDLKDLRAVLSEVLKPEEI